MTILRSDHLQFPDVSCTNKEGLLAIGGDLSVRRLLLAYRSGIFPWTDEPLTWWSPDPRAIFELATFRPHRRLADKIKKKEFILTIDKDFEGVIRNCARRAPGRETTWISPQFIQAYTELYKAGYAHSVEAWQNDELVAGVYGIAINGFFAGESMFYRVTDASKVALVFLFDYLRSRNFELFDTQVLSPLTARLGAIEVRRSEYLRRLERALASRTSFYPEPGPPAAPAIET
ncbi:leucyl/phenylalanyl-tRNA--protein transferase [Verrucomicrobia bacterium LW23]|nr:leucyl/phenylalanyl-tRNA--protein transferase [Verrucomicrobia bacterium LW23]